jgi:hypothetical protein
MAGVLQFIHGGSLDLDTFNNPNAGAIDQEAIDLHHLGGEVAKGGSS